jgi:hypothetical protein
LAAVKHSDGPTRPERGEALANAALIAAAPDLLEAAEIWTAVADTVLASCPKKTHVLQSGLGPVGRARVEHRYKEARLSVVRFRAAIARARGE